MFIDGDSHMLEPRTMWQEYCDPRERDVALRIEDDALGFSWITLRGESTGRLAQVPVPSAGQDFRRLGRANARFEAGLSNDGIPYDEMPETYWNPAARRNSLDKWGIDESLVFPNWGLQWEWPLAKDPHATRVNMEAWNRYAVEIAQEGGGRLHPVGHVQLRQDPRWVRQQLEVLSKGGIRLALCYPSIVDGRRMSHPELDPLWSAFEEFDIAATWHINSQMHVVFADADAWDAGDSGQMRLVTGLHLRTGAELALTDMAVNGVFKRHPELRIVTAEIGADWFVGLCRRLGPWYNIMADLKGGVFNAELEESPVDYLRRAVLLVCSFPTDWVPEVLTSLPDHVAFGGDFPHPEGLPDPLHDYRKVIGELPDDVATKLFGGNLASLLHA
jgi:predicted TIM-barrel fold metal-dependent hydrolase